MVTQFQKFLFISFIESKLDEEQILSHDRIKLDFKIKEEQFEYYQLQEVKNSFKTEYNPLTNQIILSYVLPDRQQTQGELLKYWTDISALDDFTELTYKRLLLEKRILAQKKSTKSACIRSLVSENRVRYKDEDFNLDLAYITPRLIAMGFPSSGLRKIYRNSIGQVLNFFQRHHENKVKIYNLCDDNFIDMSKIQLDEGTKVAYFPMMDHNPGPLHLLFSFVLDVCTYMAVEPNGIVAIHCKAGKGRTGLAVGCYLMFMEACQDAYESIDYFNKRRTIDGKGLSVPSQKRYLHYFEKFIKSTFQKPFKKLIVPLIKNPQCFDILFKPKNQLKLMSICLGPFRTNPQNLQFNIQLRSFSSENLYKSTKNKFKSNKYRPYSQFYLYNPYNKFYYILVMFHEEIVVIEDICIMFKASKLKTSALKFRYWLNAKFLLEGVGKVNNYQFQTIDQIRINNFMIIEQQTRQQQLKQTDFEEFQLVNNNTTSLGGKDSQSMSTTETQNESPHHASKRLQNNINIHQISVKDIKEQLQASINRYEQNGLKRIKAKEEIQQIKPHSSFAQSSIKKSSQKKEQLNQTTLIKNKSFVNTTKTNLLDEEYKNDVQILKRDFSNMKGDYFSESEDDQCIVKDDNEEAMIRPVIQGMIGSLDDQGSFHYNMGMIHDFGKQIGKRFQDSPVQKVSARKKVPNFGTLNSSGPDVMKFQEQDDDSFVQDEGSLDNYSIRESNFSNRQLSSPDRNVLRGIQSQKQINPSQPMAQNFEMESIVNYQNILNPTSQNPFHQLSVKSINQNQQQQNNQYLMTANFDIDDQSIRSRTLINEDQYHSGNLQRSPTYSASDEHDLESRRQSMIQSQDIKQGQENIRQPQSLKSQLSQQQQFIKESYKKSGAKNKLSMEISDRISEMQKNKKSTFGLQNGLLQQVEIQKYLSLKEQQDLHKSQTSQFSKKEKDMRKKLVQISLSAVELDKFKEISNHPEMKVMTTFLCDPQLDSLLFLE